MQPILILFIVEKERSHVAELAEIERATFNKVYTFGYILDITGSFSLSKSISNSLLDRKTQFFTTIISLYRAFKSILNNLKIKRPKWI